MAMALTIAPLAQMGIPGRFAEDVDVDYSKADGAAFEGNPTCSDPNCMSVVRGNSAGLGAAAAFPQDRSEVSSSEAEALLDSSGYCNAGALPRNAILVTKYPQTPAAVVNFERSYTHDRE